jgi:hypothetical protein
VCRASAVVYAGASAFGDLLIRHLRLPPSRVIWVPNGFDAADIDGLTGSGSPGTLPRRGPLRSVRAS